MLFPLEVLHAIPLATWRTLFRAYGCKARIVSLAEVERVLRKPPPALVWPKRMLATLCSTFGMNALVEAAEAMEENTESWRAEPSPAALVAALLARVPKAPEYKRLFEAAEYRLCRREPSAPSRRYVAASGEMRELTPSALAKMARRVARANRARLADGEVEVRVRSLERRDDGSCEVHLDLIAPRPRESVLARDDQGELVVTLIQALDVHRIRLVRSPDGQAILSIATGSPALLRACRAAVGEAFFGDKSLFLSSRPISLVGLRRMGREGLERLARSSARMRGARGVRILWDPGHEETLTAAGRDVFRAFEREELPIHGTLTSATLRIDFPSGPSDLLLRLPNVVHWEPCEEDAAVQAFVDALSIDEPPEEHYLALAPFNLTAPRWKKSIGEALFRDLVARKRLVRTTSRALAAPEQPEAGRILLAFTLAAGAYYAVPEEGFDVRPRVVHDDDLVTYRLDLVLFGTDLARGLGLTGTVKLIERGAVLDLGQRRLGAGAAHAFLQVGVRSSEGLGDRLRKESAPALPVLFVPPGHRLDSGCAEVPFASMAGPYEPLVAAMAKALSLQDGLDFWVRAPHGTRVVVERASGRIWIDGVEMVAMVEQGRKFFRILVEASGRPVSAEEVVRQLSGAANAAKNAKLRCQKGARESFDRASVRPPSDLADFIETTRDGYRLTVAWWIG